VRTDISKNPYVGFYENPYGGKPSWSTQTDEQTDGRTDGYTDLKKL